MNDLCQQPSYTKALKFAGSIQPDPQGLSDHQPSSKSDQIIIKQNNTIIVLLIELNKKLDKITKEKEVIKEQPKNTEIEELINQLKNIEITPPKERPTIVRRSQKWTFFQVEEQQPKKDHE